MKNRIVWWWCVSWVWGLFPALLNPFENQWNGKNWDFDTVNPPPRTREEERKPPLGENRNRLRKKRPAPRSMLHYAFLLSRHTLF